MYITQLRCTLIRIIGNPLQDNHLPGIALVSGLDGRRLRPGRLPGYRFWDARWERPSGGSLLDTSCFAARFPGKDGAPDSWRFPSAACGRKHLRNPLRRLIRRHTDRLPDGSPRKQRQLRTVSSRAVSLRVRGNPRCQRQPQADR